MLSFMREGQFSPPIDRSPPIALASASNSSAFYQAQQERRLPPPTQALPAPSAPTAGYPRVRLYAQERFAG